MGVPVHRGNHVFGTDGWLGSIADGVEESGGHLATEIDCGSFLSCFRDQVAKMGFQAISLGWFG